MNEVVQILKEDTWALAEGTYNSLPLVIRFRSGFTKDTDVSKLSQRILVSWVYESDNSGMPSPPVSKEMEQLEDRLVEALEHDFSGVLVAVITNDGSREWLFYSQGIDIFADRLHHMPQEEEPYPIEIVTEPDPEWNYFYDNIRPES